METRQTTTTPFTPLKKRFYIPSSPPSSDDEGDESSALPEPTFAPPPPYKQQAVVEDDVGLVAEGYNTTTGRTKDTKIGALRSFNNWVKSMLINTYCPDRGAVVLDICGGRGGDLHKFGRKNISFLVLADNARESVVEAEKRYRETGFKFPAYFICEDCFGVDLSQKLPPGICFDLVSCQFALHYSFRNEESARALLKNVSARLRPGCFFVGTTVDSDEFMRRYNRAPGRGFGNSFYNVRDINFEKGSAPGFGMEYSFLLVESVPDLKESLVPFEILVRLAREYGLEFVRKERFSPELQKKFRAEPRVPRVQGDQWEVCSIYCVFVFRKVYPFKSLEKELLSEEDIRFGSKYC